MKLIIKFLKVLLIIFTTFLLSIVIFYFYENRLPPYEKLSTGELNNYVHILSKNSSSPTDYVVSKFKKHDIVIIGEPHRISQHYIFIKSLLKPLAKEGIRYIGLEFYEGNIQEKINLFLKNKIFDEKALREIVLYDDMGFYYQELYDIFEEAWKINRLGFEINIIALEPNRNSLLDKDYVMAFKANKVAQKGNKILLYTGNHHAFSKYIQPRLYNLFFLTKPKNAKRMGNILVSEFKRVPFHISLHSISYKKYWLFAPILLYQKGLCLRFNGVLDQILNEFGRPVGFDTNTKTIEKIKDTFSYYSYGYSPLYIKNFSDGYIFLNSLKENKFVSPLKDICKSKEDIEYIKEINPEYAKNFSDSESAEYILKNDGINIGKVEKMLDNGKLSKK